MPPTERKKRERAEREGLIVTIARAMLVRDGYLGLNMDRLAQATEYAKGTIYNHFETKEDLVLAIATESKWRRAALFERAAGFEGDTRERICAVGVADAIFLAQEPNHLSIEQMIRAHSLWEKTTEGRRGALQEAIAAGLGPCIRIAQDGAAAGELDGDSADLRRILYGFLALNYGVHGLAGDRDALGLGGRDVLGVLKRLHTDYLDGVGWRPLSGERDPGGTYQRIEAELFAEEFSKIGRTASK